MKRIYLAVVQTHDYFDSVDYPCVMTFNLGAFSLLSSAERCVRERALLQFDCWDNISAYKDGNGNKRYVVTKQKLGSDDVIALKKYYIEILEVDGEDNG